MLKKIKILQSEKFYTWLTLGFLFIQGFIIAITAVNVPAGDEWESLRSNAFPSGFTFKYLFAFHNEHRIVLTKLLNYIFLYTTDWNLQYQVIFNYFIFCPIVLFILYFQKKYIPGATKGIWILPFFLASPLIVDNQNWAIQSCFHFCVLFGLLAVYYSSSVQLKMSYYWIAVICALVSMYSLAAGIFFALVTFFLLVYRLAIGRPKNGREVFLKSAAVVLMVAGMAYWFVGYHRAEGHPPFTWPYEFNFWYFYANLVSLGLGFKTENMVVAFIALALVVYVLWKNITKAFSFKVEFTSFGFFGALAVLAAFASIALSRTGLGIGQAKTSRYGELGMLLVPFIGWLLWDLVKQSPKLQKVFKYFIWFVVLGYYGTYSSYSTYFKVAEVRREALVCIGKYYTGENKSGECPALYPGPIAEMLDNAKKLNLSWVPTQK